MQGGYTGDSRYRGIASKADGLYPVPDREVSGVEWFVGKYVFGARSENQDRDVLTKRAATEVAALIML